MTENVKKALTKIIKYVSITLCIIALLFSTICSITYICGASHHTKFAVYAEMTQLKYDAVKLELANDVDAYIQSVAKGSCLNGITVVDKCIEYNTDICFVLAQGHIESHFGTAGLARKTNSVWNVYAYNGQSFDEISPKGKYQSPDESLEPYLVLLKKRYFVDGKTEYDMMHNYVDKDGNHYATAGKYEIDLANKYAKIKETTKIDSLSQELKKYAIILNY